jgi:hypothetical protein
LFVEKSKSKKAICQICNKFIEDDYRIFVYETRGVHYYHIDCIIKTGDSLKNASYKALIEAQPEYKKFIKVTKL